MLDTILLFLSALPALWGVYLIGEFLFGRFAGKIVEAEVVGFSEKKSKGVFLPLVLLDEKTVVVHRIDQLSYLINPPIVRQMIRIVTLKNGQRRVFGYAHVLVGVVCLLPFFVALAWRLQEDLMMAQVMYILIFIGMSVGGWAILKLIPKGY